MLFFKQYFFKDKGVGLFFKKYMYFQGHRIIVYLFIVYFFKEQIFDHCFFKNIHFQGHKGGYLKEYFVKHIAENFLGNIFNNIF